MAVILPQRRLRIHALRSPSSVNVIEEDHRSIGSQHGEGRDGLMELGALVP
ncbi:hypothetical protein [Streptomyces sp. NPDC002491]